MLASHVPALFRPPDAAVRGDEEKKVGMEEGRRVAAGVRILYSRSGNLTRGRGDIRGPAESHGGGQAEDISSRLGNILPSVLPVAAGRR